MFSTVFWIGRDCQMTAVKRAACSKAAVQRYQTTCRPDEFWTTVWRMWWRQTSAALRSFSVIQGHRKPICDFLLTFHSNWLHVFYRFWDWTIYWSKVHAFIAVFIHSVLVWSHDKEFFLRLRVYKGWSKKTRVPVLRDGVNRVILWVSSVSHGAGL